MNFKPIEKTQSVKTLIDFETPFKVIEFKWHQIEIRLYRTKARGNSGVQIIAVIYDRKKGFNKALCAITSGCGYNKEIAATTAAFEQIGLKPKHWKIDSSLGHEYFVGGNYHRINKSDTVKF